MTYRLAISDGCHWRRVAKTTSRRYALAMLRALLEAGIEADVRGRARP
jgi:hypothetical protein